MMTALLFVAIPVCFIVFVLSVKKGLGDDNEVEYFDQPEPEGTYWRSISDCDYAMAIASDLVMAGVPFQFCLGRKEDGDRAIGGSDTFSMAVRYRDKDVLIQAGEKWFSGKMDKFALECDGAAEEHGRSVGEIL
jgi:hypothetical protein